MIRLNKSRIFVFLLTVFCIEFCGASTVGGVNFRGLIDSHSGWHVVTSEKGKIAYIPFEGHYESKGGRIEDARGRPFPGRTVVEVVLFDEKGEVRDESGRYVVENGRRTVPIIVSDADCAAFASGKWSVTVKDLVSGLDSKASVR